MLSNKEKNFVSAVVYVRNQEKLITTILENIESSFKQIFEKYEIVCVNDASSDGSVDKIKQYASSHADSMISVLHMSFYQGMELSMNAGVDLAIGDFVYEFDSPDLTYQATLIGDVYFHALKGHDIVAAAPEGQKHKLSSLFYFIFNRVAKTQYMLRTEKFRILSRRAINRVKSMNTITPYRKAVYANCGLSTDVVFFKEDQGTSVPDRETRSSQRETAIDALVMYTDLAYRCSIAFSFLMMAVVIGSGFYTIFIYCSGKPIAGWTTTMLFLAAGFMGIFVILTILINFDHNPTNQ